MTLCLFLLLFSLPLLSAVSFDSLSVSVQSEISEKFKEFREIYKPKYKNKREENNRFNIFVNNYVEIKELAKKTSDPVGISKFSDRTKEEFNRMKGYLPVKIIDEIILVDYVTKKTSVRQDAAKYVAEERKKFESLQNSRTSGHHRLRSRTIVVFICF